MSEPAGRSSETPEQRAGEGLDAAPGPPLPHSPALVAALLCAVAGALVRAVAIGTSPVPAGLPGGRFGLVVALPLLSFTWPAGALAAARLLGQVPLDLGPAAALSLLAVAALLWAGRSEAGGSVPGTARPSLGLASGPARPLSRPRGTRPCGRRSSGRGSGASPAC